MDERNPNRIREELQTQEAVGNRLKDPKAVWQDLVFQNQDLRRFDAQLAKKDLAGCVFLGCDIGPGVAGAIAACEKAGKPHRQCLVFPKMDWLPFRTYRADLYSVDELIGRFASNDPKKEAATYERSVDWTSYRSFADPEDQKAFTNDSVDTVLARRLHDTAIADALEDLLRPIREGRHKSRKGIVAVMGGHDMPRQEKVKDAQKGLPLGDKDWEGMSDDTAYTRLALLAWRLTNGENGRGTRYLLVSGGGPGAMEAANLGAYFATRDVRQLREAIRLLEAVPKLRPGSSVEWLIPAMGVRRRFPLKKEEIGECESVGIPTWSYGHEPPNPFATSIAKYFENSVREEGLLAIATHGVVFAEGNAGTVQEIFQDACQNYYGTYGMAAPMILLGRDYWDPATMPAYANDKRKKVFPLVRKLAEEKGFTHRLIVSDSSREVVSTIDGFARELDMARLARRPCPPGEGSGGKGQMRGA